LAARAAQITHDLELISSIDPSVEDEDELLRSRAIARNSAELHNHLSSALEVLDGQRSGSGAIDALGAAWSHVSTAANIDEGHQDAASTLLAAQDQVSELAAELRSSIESLADAPGRIEQVEERLGAYDDLHRRFGGTTVAVLAYWNQLIQDAELVSDIDGALAKAQAQVDEAERAYQVAALELTQARLALADKLESAVVAELADLGMSHSVFVVGLDPVAPGPRGVESVEFRIAPAAGIEPRPISAVASGGELSRIALALHVSLGAQDTPTIIFDEIDAGIGGITAHAVGSRLARIAKTGTQVICVTHLAQVAAQSSGFVLIERTEDGTTVRSLNTEDEFVAELCRMVGAPTTEPSAWSHAQNLRAGLYTEATDA
jgi:DNA repair protein RecN (Recombination protein N)